MLKIFINVIQETINHVNNISFFIFKVNLKYFNVNYATTTLILLGREDIRLLYMKIKMKNRGEKISRDVKRFARLLKGEQALNKEQQLHYRLLFPAR